MNVESDPPLLQTLVESRSFKYHRVQWTLFYAASGATLVIFIILCALSAWTLGVAREINQIVSSTTGILADVEEMLPVLKAICTHSNFTRLYGDICRF